MTKPRQKKRQFITTSMSSQHKSGLHSKYQSSTEVFVRGKGKVIEDISLLKRKLLKEKKKNKRIVFTNGCFDLIHKGHITLLKEARKQGDILVVAINSDDSIRKLKREGRPIFPASERAEILASFQMVDFVTVFNEDTPYKIISELKPNVLVKGGDWGEDRVVGRDIVEANGGKVVIIPQIKGYSTSKIIEKIKDQRLKTKD